MIYEEKEEKQGEIWVSFCHFNLGKKYDQWLVPVRILEITPADYARLLVNEFNAKLIWHQNPYTGKGFLGKVWENYADVIRWKKFINDKAKKRGYHV